MVISNIYEKCSFYNRVFTTITSFTLAVLAALDLGYSAGTPILVSIFFHTCRDPAGLQALKSLFQEVVNCPFL